MRIVPVLDIMGREVVRGVGGRREEYRPLRGKLTASSRPLEVAEALADRFGFREFYVADLDAILGGEPDWTLYAELRRRGFVLSVDAGVRRAADARRLADAGIDDLVVGLETLEGPNELAKMVREFGTRLLFSLDLWAGRPLTASTAWPERDAETLADRAIELGVHRLLVLDLTRVGCAGGTGTRELCARLCASHPNLEIHAGGGVRHRDDLEELKRCGVQTVLVASALHDGRLSRADLEGL